MRRMRVAGLGVLIGLAIGCGDEDIDDGTNAEDSSDPSGTPNDDASDASSGALTATGSTTAGDDGICAEANEQCTEYDAASCTCNGCFDACITDQGPSSDCVCSICSEDEFCMNPENCVDGNGCDPFVEGCQCADCAEHPMCA